MKGRILSIVEIQELFHNVPKWEVIDDWAYFDNEYQHIGINLTGLILQRKTDLFFDLIKDRVWITVFKATGDFHIAVL